MSLFDTRHPGLSENRRRLSELLHLDLPLLLGLVILAVTSLFVLYSASGQNMDMVWRQVVRLGIGFGILFAMAQLNPAPLKRWTPWLFGIGLALLVAVLVAGEIGKGAQRWLDLGLFRFQPSEVMKLAVPMMVAWYLSEHRLPPSARHITLASVAIMAPTLLIAKQPDLGTALLVGSAGIFVLLFAGIPWRLVAGLGTFSAACAPVLWYFMHDYQRQRVLTLINPEHDPLGAGR